VKEPSTQSLPLFPLNATVVPGLILPLHVFETRYRRLVADLLMRPDPETREFGIIAVREGHNPVTDGIDALYPVGTSVILRETDANGDGSYDVVTVGSRRFRVHAVAPGPTWDNSAPLLMAEVEYLDEVDSGNCAPLVREALRSFRVYRGLLSGQFGEEFEMSDSDDIDIDLGDENLPEDATVISYLITAAMVLGMQERQQLLSIPDTAARLRLACRLLHRENALISLFNALPAIDLSVGSGSVN
jgi:Lon protease-like protein